MIKPIINRLRTLSQASIQGILLVTVQRHLWVFWKRHQRMTALGPYTKGPHQILLTADTIAKLENTELWMHISQLKKAPPDI